MSQKISVIVITASLLAISATGDAWAAPLRDNYLKAQDLRGEAFAAYRAGDMAAARDGMKAILELRPGHPTYLLNVASLSAKTGENDEALAALQAYAATGASVDIAADEDFAAVRDNPVFQEIVAQLKSNGEPIVRSEVAFTLDMQTGLTEGIAYDEKRDRFIVSSVSENTLYSVDRAGHAEVLELAKDHDIAGGFMGIKYSAPEDAIWVTFSAIPQVRDIDQDAIGSSGYFYRNFKKSPAVNMKHVWPKGESEGHVFGDLFVGGGIYLTDSQSPMIASTDHPERKLPVDDFVSLQGIVDAPGKGAFILADYALGLLRVELDGDKVTRLPAPTDANLRGIDGLYRYGNGLIGIQNGARPKRIIYIYMNDDWSEVTGVDVLERAVPGWEEPTLGVIVGDDFYYISNSGWTISGSGPPTPEALEKRGNIVVRRIDLADLN